MPREILVGRGRGGAGGLFGQIMAHERYLRGLQLAEQGDWLGALEEYRQACAAEPTSTTYQVARGHICQAHGLREEAAEAYRAALQVAPSNVVVLYNQALLYAAEGDLGRARSNLERILSVARELGERAAPIYARLGDLALREEDYPAAVAHFRAALRSDPTNAYARAALAAVPRLQEFGRPIRTSGQIAPKIAVYAYVGGVALGLPDDDGVDIPSRASHAFASPGEVGGALRRFLDVATAWRWGFDAVVPLERGGEPSVHALAAALNASVVPEVPYLRGGVALAVAGCIENPIAYADAVEAVNERAAAVLVYALGTKPPLWELEPPPHVLHIPAPVTFPWSAGEGAAAEHAEALGEALAEAVRSAPPDQTAAAQVAWYGRHRRLQVEPVRFGRRRRTGARAAGASSASGRGQG